MLSRGVVGLALGLSHSAFPSSAAAVHPVASASPRAAARLTLQQVWLRLRGAFSYGASSAQSSAPFSAASSSARPRVRAGGPPRPASSPSPSRSAAAALVLSVGATAVACGQNVVSCAEAEPCEGGTERPEGVPERGDTAVRLEECALFDATCQGCRQPISGEDAAASIVALGQNWHRDHFCCKTCGIVFRDGQQVYPIGDVYFCVKHAAQAAGFTCSLCGQQARPESHFVTSLGEVLCHRHEQDLTDMNGSGRSCFSCGRPVDSPVGSGRPNRGSAAAAAGGCETYGHGSSTRHICHKCSSSAVDTPEALKELRRDVASTLDKMGIGLGEGTPVMLVDRLAYSNTTESAKPVHTEGLTLKTFRRKSLFSSSVEHGVSSIQVLSGLPYVHAGKVLSHELVHAWIHMQGFPELPLEVEEGLCELVSYIWLSCQLQHPAHRLDALFWLKWMETPCQGNPYNEGFVQAWKALAGRSFQQVLRYVYEHGKLPPIT